MNFEDYKDIVESSMNYKIFNDKKSIDQFEEYAQSVNDQAIKKNLESNKLR